MSAIPVGPFDLVRPIGSGGMGEVWSAVHRATGLPVAVKVLGQRGGDRLLEAFRNEVRQAARLEHPGIVMVLDHGEISEEAAILSGGRLVAGSPYLAMEYASGGSLDRWGAPAGWEELRDVLLALLDALAHAHAREVIHRDIKPGNVLRSGGPDLRPGVKLTDFGLAQALHELEGPGRAEAAGTPAYMAPEQIRGLWREQGPWTDLYAVGCLAYALACGRAPYSGGPADLVRAHLGAPLPQLLPQIPVPDGLEGWIHRLLQKEPRQRFGQAADAAWALLRLEARGDPFARPAPGFTLYSYAASPSAFYTTNSTMSLDPLPQPPAGGAPAAAAPPAAGRAPVPQTWARPTPPPTPPRLIGVGLSLYGLRAPPLAGRAAERDALWSALRGVAESGRPAAVLLRGPAGVGKSHLARWILERSQEVGAAAGVAAHHSPAPTPGAGVEAALARRLRCADLQGEALNARLDALAAAGSLEGAAPDAVARLLQPDRAGLEPAERRVLLRRLLAGGDRAVVLLLEDVQWGADALALGHHLLAARDPEPLPVLLLLTCRDDLLPERPAEAALLEKMRSLPGFSELSVGPLPDEALQELVEKLLLLERDLGESVRQRCAGNPLFAVRLVGDWVRRGVLQVGAAGFQLRPGESAALPDDLHRVWQAALEPVLAGLPGDARLALQVAAALGREVDGEEWAAAAAAAGAPLPAGLAERLLRADLAAGSPQSWSWIHGMLRESVEREAVEAGAWAAAHAACAAVLATRPGPWQAERAGRHLAAAGQRAECLPLLLAGAAARLEISDLPGAQELLGLREQALEQLGAPPGDRRWGETWIVRIRACIGQGEYREADQLAGRCAEAARRYRWPDLQRRALRYRAMAAEKRGDLSVAEALFLQAQVLAEAAGDDEGRAACLEHRGTVLRQRGDGAGSLALLSEALTLYERVGSARLIADCRKEIGGTLVTLGRPEEAEDHLRRALAGYEGVGHASGRAQCYNNLAEVHRRRGELAAAEEDFLHALALMERLGSQARTIPLANLGLVRIARGRYAPAEEALRRALALAQRLGQKSIEAYVHTFLLPCLAAAGDWAGWDAHLAAADHLLLETGLVDPDLAGCARLAETLARGAGQAARAQQAAALAETQRVEDGPDADPTLG